MAAAWLHDVYFLIALIITGIIAGYLAGLFGVGGGGVLVPVLATIFPYFGDNPAMDMHCAIGTALALIIPGAVTSTLHHAKQGTLEENIWKLWLVAVTVGIIIGVLITKRVEGELLKIVFAVYMFIVAAVLYFKQKKPGDHRPHYPSRLVQIGVGTGVGCLSSILGLGGGSFTVPFYNQYNIPLKRAIALGNVTGIAIGLLGAIGAMVNGWGLVGRPGFSIGYVNIPAFLIISPLTMLCAPKGTALSFRLSSRTLKNICAGFYLLMGIYMIINLWLVA